MDDGCSTPPQLPPSETQSRGMGGSSTPPQLSPLKTKSRSMDGSSTSTPPPQLPPSEAESCTSTPPRLPPNSIINQQEVELMQRPPPDLGLKLTMTPEFSAKVKPELDVSKFPVTSISIGPTWRRESRREDDLTLKLYFTMKKLVWVFLGPWKEKIEVSWSDITAIQARAPADDQPAGVLRIQLGKKPLFFRFRISPTFTGWEPTSDFTVVGDHALYHRIHEAKFAHRGVLHQLLSAFLRNYPRLLELSKNPFPPYPNPTQQQHHAPCLPSVNNPTPSNSTPPSQSQSCLYPIPLTAAVDRFPSMGSSSRNANQYYQTPLLMPQQLPFSLTGVEQSLLYNNPTPSLAASQYLNPAMTTAVVSSPRIGETSIFHMEGESSSSRNAEHHQTPLVLFGDHNTARTALESNIYGGEQWQELGSNNYSGTGVTEQPWPELDGDGNTGNDPMDLYTIVRSANITRRPT